ncbi:MAG: ACT domain-containing protein [Candidatus Acidiferrum sp.]
MAAWPEVFSSAMTLSLRRFQLSLLPESFAVVGLSARAELPAWATEGPFFSVTRTSDELSIIVEESRVPGGVQFQGGWRVIKVHGPFILSEVGVLAALAGPLAAAKISLLVVTTFDTDYLLVASDNLAAAVATLERAGHSFQRSPSK